MTGYVHKIGATLHMQSEVRIGGQPCDLTDWTASARLRGKGFFFDFTPELAISDSGTTLTLRADSGEQTAWRAGDARLDVRLSGPDSTLISATGAFTLVSPVTPE
ncbi:MAG: hypothetical protein LBF61_00845 [Azoarcus sp.]|jgi:hypothetical protein|nr:hypothetical protein [Azoarcus sp.]